MCGTSGCIFGLQMGVSQNWESEKQNGNCYNGLYRGYIGAYSGLGSRVSQNYGYLIGGPVIRIVVSWGLYWGPLILGN